MSSGVGDGEGVGEDERDGGGVDNVTTGAGDSDGSARGAAAGPCSAARVIAVTASTASTAAPVAAAVTQGRRSAIRIAPVCGHVSARVAETEQSVLPIYRWSVYNVLMQEPTFLILTALADEPRHGYGVIQEVTALSGGRVTLRPGTLYAALDRLVAEGLVAVAREEIVASRLRRYYRLTANGATALADEAARLQANAAAARRRLRRAEVTS